MSVPPSTGLDVSHWQAALDATAACAARCRAGHPLRSWRACTEELIGIGAQPPSLEAFVERLVVPATYLRRFGQSLNALGSMTGRPRAELGALRDADGFMHLEYLMYLAWRIGAAGETVTVVGQKTEPAPDLEVAAWRYAIECTARGPRSPRHPFNDDFEHAQAKFEAFFHTAGRAAYWGVLATDLGVCGSPSLPNIARLGSRLDATHDDVVACLEKYPRVDVLLLTWSTVEVVTQTDHITVGLVNHAGWISRDGGIDLPGLTNEFDRWEDRSPDVARRTAVDGRDPRRP